MTQSEDIKELLAAIVKAQAEFPTMPKDKEGYGYKYTDLDTIVMNIKPIMEKHQLGFIQPLTTEVTAEGGIPAITTRVFHSSGEYIEDTVLLPSVEVGKANSAQKIGAAVTYFRRYGLCSMLGISCDEDTDAAVQSNPVQKPQKPVQKTKGPSPDMKKLIELMDSHLEDGAPAFPEEVKEKYRAMVKEGIPVQQIYNEARSYLYGEQS